MLGMARTIQLSTKRLHFVLTVAGPEHVAAGTLKGYVRE